MAANRFLFFNSNALPLSLLSILTWKSAYNTYLFNFKNKKYNAGGVFNRYMIIKYANKDFLINYKNKKYNDRRIFNRYITIKYEETKNKISTFPHYIILSKTI